MPALRHPEDRRSIALAAVHLALVALVARAIDRGVAGWVLAVTLPLLAISSFIQLISTHNAMHTPVFVKKPYNRVWQAVLSVCICYPVSIFVPVHNLSHHLGLQTPRDVLRTTEVRHRWNLLNLLHHMVMGTVHLHLLHLAYLRTMARSRPRWLVQVACEATAVGVYLLGLGAWLGPLAVLAAFVLPAVTGQLLIVGLGYVQHDGCDPASPYAHSRNFLGSVLNWFLFDNGYHTAHHDTPALHWSRCRTAHAALASRMPAGVNEPSLVRYLCRTFVWPARRVRYDGAPVQLPPRAARRELWTPASAIQTGASSGAVEG